MLNVKIQNTIVSLCQEPENTLSQEMLTLSSTLQNFCQEAFNSSMIAGSTVSHLFSSFAGFKTFALCSKLFGNQTLWATKTITCTTQILTSGITFHLLPNFFATGTIQQENLFAGSATSTMMIAFSKGAARMGGGKFFQAMAQNLAVLCSQETSSYLGLCEAQTGGAVSRIIYAQLGSSQLSMGACATRLTCRQMALIEAQMDLNQSLQKRTIDRTTTDRAWLQSVQSFFKIPYAKSLATDGVPVAMIDNRFRSPLHSPIFEQSGVVARVWGEKWNHFVSKVRGKLGETEKLKPQIIKKGKQLALASVAFAFDLTRRVDIARLTPPNITLPKLKTETLPAPPRDIIDGAGFRPDPALLQRISDHSQKVFRDLKTTPKTLHAYRAYLLDTENFRVELQKRFTPVLQQLAPLLENLEVHVRDSLRPAVEAYEREVAKLFPSGREKITVEVLLNLTLADEIQNHNLRDSYTDETLRVVGYEPKSIEWTPKQCHVFRPGMIETLLDSSLDLQTAVGAESLRNAARKFDQSFEERMQGGKKSKESEDASDQNFKDLKTAFKDFLKDRSVATLWLAENTLHASIRKLLNKNEGEILQHLLSTLMPEDIRENYPQMKIRVEDFLTASREVERIKEEMGRQKRGVVDQLAALVDTRDYHDLQMALGKFENAKAELLIHHANALIQPTCRWLKKTYSVWFEKNGSPLETLMEARINVSKSEMKWAQILEEGFTPDFISAMEKFRTYYDAGMSRQRELGLQIGFERYEEILEGQIRPIVGEKVYTEKIAPMWEAIKRKEGEGSENKGFEAKMKEYKRAMKVLSAGRGEPRSINRLIEAPAITILNQAHPFVLQTAAQYGIQLGPVSHFIPGFESYVEAIDQTNWRSLIPYTLPILGGKFLLDAGRQNGYSIAHSRAEILRVITTIVDKLAPQTFYIDPNIKPVINYKESWVVAACHTNHPEIMDAVVLQRLVSDNADSAEPLAKAELSIPGIDDSIQASSILVKSTPWGVRMAQAIASEVTATGSPIRQRSKPVAGVVFPQRTMGIANDPGIFGEEYPARTHEILPTTEGALDIAQGATVLSGRSLPIVSLQAPGTSRLRENQHVKFDLKRLPSSVVVRTFPFSGIPYNPDTHHRLDTPANDFFRILWLIDGHDHRFDTELSAFYAGQNSPVKTTFTSGYRKVLEVFTGVKMLFTNKDSLNFE